MSDARDTQEPSMEEILSSIRRIIADEEGDDGATAPDPSSAGRGARGGGAGAGAAAAGADEDEAEDVLDLTQRVEEDGEVVDLNARAAQPGPASPGGAAQEDEVELEPDQPEPGPAVAARGPAAGAAGSAQQPEQRDRSKVANNQRKGGTLVAETAAGAATNAFAKLSQVVQPTPADQRIASSDGRSIEEFAEDILRPMLKEWLDENLPGLVEQLVEREINKIARRAELL